MKFLSMYSDVELRAAELEDRVGSILLQRGYVVGEEDRFPICYPMLSIPLEILVDREQVCRKVLYTGRKNTNRELLVVYASVNMVRRDAAFCSHVGPMHAASSPPKAPVLKPQVLLQCSPIKCVASSLPKAPVLKPQVLLQCSPIKCVASSPPKAPVLKPQALLQCSPIKCVASSPPKAPVLKPQALLQCSPIKCVASSPPKA
jgi:hypothetical protein